MKKLMFNNQVYEILEETKTHYTCKSHRPEGGIIFFSKNSKDISLL